MTDWLKWWGLIPSLAFIAATFVAIKSGGQKKISDLHKEEAEAWKQRAERLDGDLRRLDEKFEAYKVDAEKRFVGLEAANKQLAEMASGAHAVDELRSHIDQQHSVILAAINANTIASTNSK